jgi:hypothetical protein
MTQKRALQRGRVIPDKQVFWISRINLFGVLITTVGLAGLVGGGIWAVLQQLWSTPGTFRLDWTTIIAALFGLVVFVGVLAPQMATWLVISPDGLEFHVIGLVLLAAWTDVRSIESVRFLGGRGGWSEDVLWLDQSRLQGNRVLAWLLQANRWDHYVPLTRFTLNWRSARLGTLIERYAPDLPDHT